MKATEIVQAKIDSLQSRKEELRNELQKQITNSAIRGEIISICDKLFALQELLEELKSADPWVNCGDRLPETPPGKTSSGWKLVYDEGQQHEEVAYYSQVTGWQCEDGRVLKVVLWMDIPTFKQEKQNQ